MKDISIPSAICRVMCDRLGQSWKVNQYSYQHTVIVYHKTVKDGTVCLLNEVAIIQEPNGEFLIRWDRCFLYGWLEEEQFDPVNPSFNPKKLINKIVSRMIDKHRMEHDV